MVGIVDLLAQAKAAELIVQVQGTRLILRGPRSAEVLVKNLLEHKEQIMALLQPTNSQPPDDKDIAQCRIKRDHWAARWHKGLDYLEAMQARGESKTAEFKRLFAEWAKIDAEYKRLDDLYDELLVQKRSKKKTVE
jgi:hypothetical protein